MLTALLQIEDFEQLPGTVTIPAGQRFALVRVQALPTAQDNRTVVLPLKPGQRSPPRRSLRLAGGDSPVSRPKGQLAPPSSECLTLSANSNSARNSNTLVASANEYLVR